MTILTVIALALLVVAPTSGASVTATLPVTQQQWRANYMPWDVAMTVFTSTEQSDFVVQGNNIHDMVTYDPVVSFVRGASETYTFDGTVYVLHQGTVKYEYDYGTSTTFTVFNEFDGWISFSDKPISDTNNVVTAGQVNQWVLVKGATTPFDSAQPLNGQWWLVGFSTYIYGSTGTLTQAEFYELAIMPP